MPDSTAEVPVHGDETPGEGSGQENFEDATDGTPHLSPAKPKDVGDTDASKSEGQTGLGIDSAGDQDAPEPSKEEQDEAEYSNGAETISVVRPALDEVPELPRPISRDHSTSPSRRPLSSGRQSPSRHMKGLSGDLTVTSQPPPSTSNRLQALDQRRLGATSPPQPGLARKASSGFAGLLGRMGSIRKARSPPAPRENGRFGMERRNTGASVTSPSHTGSDLPTIADDEEGGRGRPSLQDRFQNARRQEEFAAGDTEGTTEHDHDEARTKSDAGLASPDLNGDGVPRFTRAASTPGPLKSPELNPRLPPGTASGLSAGPSEEPTTVDWDFWQSVVYEGPAAVARTSSEELDRAIAAGIPAAIRGVVWQVLAESKNEELENIYRTLKARGTEAEPLRPAPLSRQSSQNNVNGSIQEKESIASSRSSIHSDTSTPATSGLMSPPLEQNTSDLQSQLLAEKLKRESATLAKLEKAIKRDMGSRTSYSKYTQSAGLQDGLFGVCKAYALFDEGVGYAQGINFIAMPLLFNMSEDEAFTLLVRLMSKYDVRSLFTADMTGLHMRLHQFERLLEDRDPALYCHLKRRHVDAKLYATQWFLTLFAYRFPLQLVLRVYDLIFRQGLVAILRFGLILMEKNRDALLAMKDMSQLSTFLKEKLFDAYIDKSPSSTSLLDSGFFGSVTGGADRELYRADELVRDACTVTISSEALAEYTTEWEESQRLERERTEELETLRTTHGALILKVKRLEEQSQAQDTEHVTIASDLVRIKVENDMLHDDNEGLKMKVEELQRLVDAQPAEIEDRLKQEMERIMQRNIEVQNENRMLKEEAEEMEQAFVQVKMNHAQMQADHDGLKQKWSNLQAMINNKT